MQKGGAMKHHFIINPAAGHGALASGFDKKIQGACDVCGVDYDIYTTKGVGDATDYVRSAAEREPDTTHRFYACGGDGTLCEVVNGVMRLERPDRAYVGTVPSGTGNDFVRNFTSPDKFFDLSAQIAAKPMRADLIACNDMYAVNMVNIGFDCEVVCKKADIQKRGFIPSKLAYIAGLVVTLIRKPGVRARISYDGGEAIDKQMLLTTYANGEFCGGGFHSNPLSRLNNGKIDALAVKNISRLKFISIVGTYKKGTHLKYTDILENRQVESVDMYFGGPTNISVDGEVIVAPTLKLRSVKDAFNFLVPAGCEYIREKLGSVEEVAVNA